MRYTVAPRAAATSAGDLILSRASKHARTVLCGWWLPMTFAEMSEMPAISQIDSTIWLHRSPDPALAGMSLIFVLQCFACCSWKMVEFAAASDRAGVERLAHQVAV